MSPRKIRLIADLIRGRNVDDALVQLDQVAKAARLPVRKLLAAATSNAQNVYQLDPANLFVKEIRINEGPTMYRWMPRALGRATPIRKRMSHLHLILGERVPTADVKATTTPAASDDIIKVGSFDELKALEKTDDQETRLEHEETSGSKPKGPAAASGGASKKGFASKVFNRKSG